MRRVVNAEGTEHWLLGDKMSISNRYLKLKEEVADACIENGRDVSDCLLLSVSKTTDIDGIAQAIEAGAVDFGENRPDQLVEKHAAFPEARWHFIGNIQSRRIRDIVPCAYLIHSLDKFDHAKKISDVASGIEKVQDVLIEVNVSGEESKSGIEPACAYDFVCACQKLEGVRVRGLMTMAPQGDLKVAQDSFAKLRDLKAEIAEKAHDTSDVDLDAFGQLSMGMSEDWREAVAEGSTIVRLGRAIFSEEF